MLSSACRQLRLPTREVRIDDDLDRLRAVIREAEDSDLLLISGGLSMGEYDYVARALALEDADLIFHRLPIRPGKPVLGARLRDLVVVGLPGNPVSSLVAFYLFARPVIGKLMGWPHGGIAEVTAQVETETAGSAGRTFFSPALLRVAAQGLTVRALETHGSGDLAGFSAANALLVIPADRPPLVPGGRATVLVLAEDWMHGV
jgi:molybdopterin molybdotransferase